MSRSGMFPDVGYVHRVVYRNWFLLWRTQREAMAYVDKLRLILKDLVNPS